MSFLYSVALFLLILFCLPYGLYQLLFKGKYRKSLKNRLGFDLPSSKSPSIWLHMVSVGETRSILPLYEKLKKTSPNTPIFLSTITETGLAEARRSFKGAAGYFILPFDFPWAMRRLCKKLRPKLLLLSEGDLWFSMLRSARKEGAKIALVSAKLSEKSYKRFSKVPFFAKALFGTLDCVCAQNELYAERLRHFSPKVSVTGNLKLDAEPPLLSAQKKEELQKKLQIKEGDTVVTLGSTHLGEEELLLSLLLPLPIDKILLVPRHPERFERVFASLPPGSGRFSAPLSGREKVILIDTMGQLTNCYKLCKLAIVCGSFVPGIGGHNILEPIQAHIPALFGPYMQTQEELVDLVLGAKAGVQLDPEELQKTVRTLLEDPTKYKSLQQNSAALALSCRGALERTWRVLEEQVFTGKLGTMRP